MFYSHPLNILVRRHRLLLTVGLVFAGASLLITLLFPLQYRADAQVLIISRTRTGVDPYTVVKSAERVGENIAAVMKTDDFFAKVKDQKGYTIDWRPFTNLPERDKRKRWQKTVQASVVYGTGVLNVGAYDENAETARSLAGAVVDTLAARGWEYVGGDVTIKVVNAPVSTRWPVRPNLIVNVMAGLVAGMLLTSVIVMRRG